MNDVEHSYFKEHQSVALILLVAIAAALFVATTLVARAYIRSERTLAQRWYTRGEAALAQGHPSDAVEEFRTAESYSRTSGHRMELARALVASGRYDEARAYLLNLWEEQPASGPINLLLARLAASKGEVGQAQGYYRASIYGVWDEEEPAVARSNVRFELAEFLLNHHDAIGAESDLLVLSENLPSESAARIRIAGLFLRAGDKTRALQEYEKALRKSPGNAEALAAAGKIAFEQGSYRQAKTYLEHAVKRDPQNTDAAQALQQTDMVLRMDPFAPRLSVAERSRRATAAYHQALTRLRSCATSVGADLTSSTSARQVAQGMATPQQQQDLQASYASSQQLLPVSERALLRDPDKVYAVMDWANAAEQAAARVCGAPTGADLALVLIGKESRP